MVYNLQNKNEIFLKLIFHKKINEICHNFFRLGAYKKDKNIYQFDALHSRILYAKSKSQNLHIDSRICGVYPPTHIHFFVYLKKVSEQDGPTQVVPKSHRINKYPTKKDQTNAIKITGDQGTVIALDSSIWHGSSKKISSNPRAILTLSYSRWHIRQTFAVPYSMPKKILNKLNKKQKILLGFFNYPSSNEKKRLRMRGELTTLKVKAK
jgi:ectoine hydroxylase-related dioxygenase (phytanoyl-CoA dioxygenase family)